MAKEVFIKEPASRISRLDGLRGLAVAAVMANHFYHLKLLWFGVDMFFVLSGYLITSILLRRTHKTFGEYIGAFYSRRARRILPPYVLLLVVTTILFGAGFLRHWYMYIGTMNFLLPLRISYPETLTPLWSLGVEEQFYLLWPLAVLLLNRRALLRFTLVLLLAAPILRYTCTPLFNGPWAVYMLLPFRMDDLAAGALVAQLWPAFKDSVEANPLNRTVLYLCSAIAVIVSLAVIFLLGRRGITTFSNTRMGNTLIYEFVLVLMLGIFVAVLAGFGHRVLSFPALVWLGTVSYSAYLIHLTMLRLLPGKAGVPAITGTLAYAGISWYAMERPLTRGRESKPENLVVLKATD